MSTADVKESSSNPIYVPSTPSASLKQTYPGSNEWFFGRCLCHPSLEGVSCDQPKMSRWNPWVANEQCMQYNMAAYDSKDPSCTFLQGDGKSKACQYYCFWEPVGGVVRINRALWETAHTEEANIWQGFGGG
jgi:hypothetical protein